MDELFRGISEPRQAARATKVVVQSAVGVRTGRVAGIDSHSTNRVRFDRRGVGLAFRMTTEVMTVRHDGCSDLSG
jgi:hypothetical protein